MSGYIGKSFFDNTDQAVFNIFGDFISHIIIKGDRTKLKIRDQSMNCFLKVNGFVMKVMNACPDTCHGLIQRLIQVIQHRGQSGFCADCFCGSGEKNGAGKKMAYIVVDFPCDPVALFQGSGVDLIILFFCKNPVFSARRRFFSVLSSRSRIRRCSSIRSFSVRYARQRAVRKASIPQKVNKRV